MSKGQRYLDTVLYSLFSEEENGEPIKNIFVEYYFPGIEKTVKGKLLYKLDIKTTLFRLCMSTKVNNTGLVNKRYEGISNDIVKYSKDILKCTKNNIDFLNPLYITIENFKLFCILYMEFCDVMVDDDFININKNDVMKGKKYTFKYPTGYRLSTELSNFIDKSFPKRSKNVTDTNTFTLCKLARHWLLGEEMTTHEHQLFIGLITFDKLHNYRYNGGVARNVVKSNVDAVCKFVNNTYKNIISTNQTMNEIAKMVLDNIGAADLTEKIGELMKMLGASIQKDYVKQLRILSTFLSTNDSPEAALMIESIEHLLEFSKLGFKTFDNITKYKVFNRLESTSLHLGMINIGIGDIKLDNKADIISILANHYDELKNKSDEEIATFMQSTGFIEYAMIYIFRAWRKKYVGMCENCIDDTKEKNVARLESENKDRIIKSLNQTITEQNVKINELNAKDTTSVKYTEKLYKKQVSDLNKDISNLKTENDKLIAYIKQLELEKQELIDRQNNQEVKTEVIVPTDKYKVLVIGNIEHKNKIDKLRDKFGEIEFLNGNNANYNFTKSYYKKFDVVAFEWGYLSHVSMRYVELAKEVTTLVYLNGNNDVNWYNEIVEGIKEKILSD